MPRYKGYGMNYGYRRKNPFFKLIKSVIYIAILFIIFYYLSPYIMPILMQLLPDLKNIHFPGINIQIKN